MDRIERLRGQLDQNPWLEDTYELDKIDERPALIRRMGRKVLDAFKIRSEKSEKRRDREAMGVVLNEYRMEKEQRRIEATQREEERLRARQKREREEAEYREGLERKALENDMDKARRAFEAHEQERFEGQRVQEMLEKELNSRLTTVEGLEEAVWAEEEGVSKTSVEFEGEEIPVYNLTGKPFEMISHAVDYRYANWQTGNASIGNKTAQDLLQHPEQWEQTRSEVEAKEGYGTRREDALGDVISASYINSETNIDTRVSRFGNYYTLCYGFDKMRPDSMLYVSNGDAGSSNTGGKGETNLGKNNVDAIHLLQGKGASPMYNEVVLRRYDENGEPLKPSYIISENGHITDNALRHAKHFGIPIVNIERKNYDDRLVRRAIDAVNKITDESSYDEISDAITVLRRAPRYFDKFHEIESVGRVRDKRDHEREKKFGAPGSMEQKICALEELELVKRIDLIEDALRAGKVPGLSKPKGFEYFSVLDIKNNGMPSSCDLFSIEFRRKGDSRFVRTEIYDGGNVIRGDEAVQMGYMTQEEVDGGDSSYYQRLAPLVQGYNRR